MKENNAWHGLSLNTIYNMDCIEGMKLIPDGSIDCIITDPPYWTTACKRDTVIPFDLMWEQLKRIIKPNWAIVLFWSEPFSSALRMSNIKMYKYDWIWEKSKATGYLNSKKQPMRSYENICVFYEKQCTYNAIMTKWEPYFRWKVSATSEHYWKQTLNHIVKSDNWDRFPRQNIYYKTAEFEGRMHPTQKPVALIEYLIKTYSLEDDVILDFTSGSWTTAIASINTNRNYIWFELDENYWNIANKRIQDRLSDNTLF